MYFDIVRQYDVVANCNGCAVSGVQPYGLLCGTVAIGFPAYGYVVVVARSEEADTAYQSVLADGDCVVFAGICNMAVSQFGLFSAGIQFQLPHL